MKKIVPPLRRKRDRKAAEPRHIYDEAAHWHNVVIPELINEARQFEIILSGEPSLARAIDLWKRQSDGLEFAARGDEDPARGEKTMAWLRDGTRRWKG
jgi:hypothetical protein